MSTISDTDQATDKRSSAEETMTKVANVIKDRITTFDPTMNHQFVIGLEGCVELIPLYKALERSCRAQMVSFEVSMGHP